MSLDKLKERGLKGATLREKYKRETLTRDKAKILNNLNGWVVRGSNCIYNLKTHQYLEQKAVLSWAREPK
ncbi:MAG: hypothetical protein MRERC_12c031 [Mycoplasmataceae bacterium RC_NB112A]|nr:MAG: hypothetical protein MRERC_12c031 [Mycoplasmataceae bacterium RC_NB112A]